jgi:hypothetical protein
MAGILGSTVSTWGASGSGIQLNFSSDNFHIYGQEQAELTSRAKFVLDATAVDGVQRERRRHRILTHGERLIFRIAVQVIHGRGGGARIRPLEASADGARGRLHPQLRPVYLIFEVRALPTSSWAWISAIGKFGDWAGTYLLMGRCRK